MSGYAQDDGFEARVRQIISDFLADPITNIPNAFKQWQSDYAAINIPTIPIGQIVGFTAFTAKAATLVPTSELIAGSSYDDLNTIGPTLTGLLDGSYIFLFGATATPGSSTTVRMSLQYDATTAVDADSILWGTASAPGMIAIAHTLTSASSSNNHTVTAKYKSDGTNNATWQNRWLIGFRYASA